ncbi:hypothetical protein CR513_60016, partial [Mucuna pruriens]
MDNCNEIVTPIETNVKLIKKVEKSIVFISYWCGDKVDRKGTFDSLFQFLNAPISWWSNKQSVVALSSCVAEYSCFTSILLNSIFRNNI